MDGPQASIEGRVGGAPTGPPPVPHLTKKNLLALKFKKRTPALRSAKIDNLVIAVCSQNLQFKILLV